tara:strand:+ start:319 stop:546 length:228 start_codon:yes stop_codon:yes gene_type:complete
MGTLLPELQNQKNRQALTHTKRKPTAATDIMSVTYIGTKNAHICGFLACFGVVFGVYYGETALSYIRYTPSNFFI